jgi:hypothetical protein
MPSGKNWFYFIFINLAFILYIIGIYYFISIEEIKNNWPKYRCNPMYMFLSDNITNDFNYCIQNTQSNYMGHMLQPLTFITESITSSLGNFMNEINMVRAMIYKIRTFLSDTIQSVFGVFLNLVIEFQRITIAIKDIIAKTIGILVTLLYTLDGSIKTMNSAWKGPTGQMVRALGKCFHPETKLTLFDGTKVCMKDILLGSILADGTIVDAVLQIDNKRDKQPFYKINQINGEPIFVTGEHSIYDTKTKKYILVKNYDKAEETTIVYDWFSCLVTNNHTIPIGEYIFWDWEDQLINE